MRDKNTVIKWIFAFLLIHLSSSSVSITDWKISHQNSTVVDKILKYVSSTDLLGSEEKCVQTKCSIVCFNGKIGNIGVDVTNAINSTICTKIEELHIYFYEFPNRTLSNGFLGDISNRVVNLRIVKSPIKWISPNAFNMKYLKSVFLENLQLDVIEDDVLNGAPESLNSISVIQTEKSIQTIGSGFLYPVKYSIRQLTMNIGLMTPNSLTSSECLLSGLEMVDLSNNNFQNNLDKSSFKRLSLVVDLNLSNSNITFLPEHIFLTILDTLRKLDLSHNALKTISMNIFGLQDPLKDFKMRINGNNWECSCDTYFEMQVFFKYQLEQAQCVSPEKYAGLSVFDGMLCGTYAPDPPYIPTTTSSPYKLTSTSTTGTIIGSWETSDEEQNMFECEINESNDTSLITIAPQQIDFKIRRFSSAAIEITFSDSSDFDQDLGMIWFRDVTTQYYKMEINYNAYGLGCFTNLTRYTIIDELHPDTAYTFCMIRKGQMNISPLSCKAFHMTANLQVGLNFWISKSMRTTGISLLIFGILLFMFFGMCLVFYIIRRRPTLVKGSKRVVMPNNSTSDIIVFPKRDSKDKGRVSLSQRNSSSFNCRRPSIVSIESNQSYMTPNIYEHIPAYQRYLKTLSDDDPHDSVNYSEIPFRKNRMSSDPLPAIPNTITSEDIFKISEPYTFMIEDSHV